MPAKSGTGGVWERKFLGFRLDSREADRSSAGEPGEIPRRRCGRSGEAARAEPATNCGTPGGSTCAAGGDTSDWPRTAGPSSDWRDGFDGTSGTASGCGGTVPKGRERRYAGLDCVAGCCRLRHAAGERGIWPGRVVCIRRLSNAVLRRYGFLMPSDLAARLTPLGSTAGCGKPHVRWCGRVAGRNPRHPTRSVNASVSRTPGRQGD